MCYPYLGRPLPPSVVRTMSGIGGSATWMRGQNHGVLVFGVAVSKGLLSQFAFAAINSNAKHIYAVSLSPGEMPTCPPTCKIVVVKSMLSSFSQLLVSKYLPMDSTSSRTALVRWSFLASRPMFPLWAVQLLPTSPQDQTYRRDQNESR